MKLNFALGILVHVLTSQAIAFPKPSKNEQVFNTDPPITTDLSRSLRIGEDWQSVPQDFKLLVERLSKTQESFEVKINSLNETLNNLTIKTTSAHPMENNITPTESYLKHLIEKSVSEKVDSAMQLVQAQFRNELNITNEAIKHISKSNLDTLQNVVSIQNLLLSILTMNPNPSNDTDDNLSNYIMDYEDHIHNGEQVVDLHDEISNPTLKNLTRSYAS